MKNGSTNRSVLLLAVVALAGVVVPASAARAGQGAWDARTRVLKSRDDAAAMLIAYFEEICRPKPFEIRTGAELKARQRALREKLLACAGLWPLPERVPLDARLSAPLDHEWCTIRRVHYQLWPEVYSSGLLYVPKEPAAPLAGEQHRPAPAVLSTHGHWQDGNAHPVVQTRCLVLAKMGYVVFSSTQNHYEDLPLGVSHQTLMIWNNIRALDYLQSLPEVDKARIGCTGCSGGGLQTQMLLAADDRVKAASIVGMTCDYREILFPGRNHCACNHFPNIMRHTDEPELSALGLPTPVQYLTMNDWTRSFEQNNYPTISKLYEANGMGDRTDCKYWPTGHDYDKPKRERMYQWMEKWLRGKDLGGPVTEPETKTLPVKALADLKAEVPGDRGLPQISRIYEQAAHYAVPKIADGREWKAYRQKMRGALEELLGPPVAPPRATVQRVASDEREGVVIERILCPSEGGVAVPTLFLRPANYEGKLSAIVICDDRGKDAVLSTAGDGSPMAQARSGYLIVLPDVRFVGELSLSAFAGLSQSLLTFKACCPLGEGPPDAFEGVWQRNALLWGRPLPGMAATDIRAVLDAVAARQEVGGREIVLVGRGNLAIAALFAAALDSRAAAVDIDLGSHCFEKRDLPLVPSVLQHGDVLQWAALLADRRLTLAAVPREAGDPEWLKGVFRVNGNPDGLKLAGQ